MQLSVIIVNYNTRYFIQLCLQSVLLAMQKIQGEVIVVDNASQDDSCNIIEQKFPEVKLVRNQDNLGFAKANNLGIRMASGRFVLLLNPDTIVPEDCFEKCITYLELQPDVGALGVKMIDGSATFLPESKRGLPTPQSAFYKMMGLHRFFPNSPKLAHYYHGNLPENEINSVEVLTGAFFMARKDLGDSLGWLDEDYFMYGEDIDLSYSFTQTGHKLVYFPDTFIVHFKGESSKNIDKRYIDSFFGAMTLFYKKHFKEQYSKTLQVLVLMGIRSKAMLTSVSQRLNNHQSENLDWQDFKTVLVASQKDTLDAYREITGKEAGMVIHPEKMNTLQIGTNMAFVFTSDFSYQDQLSRLQPGIPCFFMAPDNSFILGSPSKKWNGLVMERKHPAGGNSPEKGT